MPWWAWLLIDLVLVGAAGAVVAVIALRFYRRTRRFLSVLGALDIPTVDRPRGR